VGVLAESPKGCLKVISGIAVRYSTATTYGGGRHYVETRTARERRVIALLGADYIDGRLLVVDDGVADCESWGRARLLLKILRGKGFGAPAGGSEREVFKGVCDAHVWGGVDWILG
jgi:hypothetical protein